MNLPDDGKEKPKNEKEQDKFDDDNEEESPLKTAKRKMIKSYSFKQKMEEKL